MFIISKQQAVQSILKQALKAVLVVIVAFAGVFYISGKITNISSGLKKKQQQTLALENRSTLALAIQNDTKDLGNNDEKIANAFPAANNILPFVSTLKQT